MPGFIWKVAACGFGRPASNQLKTFTGEGRRWQRELLLELSEGKSPEGVFGRQTGPGRQMTHFHKDARGARWNLFVEEAKDVNDVPLLLGGVFHHTEEGSRTMADAIVRREMAAAFPPHHVLVVERYRFGLRPPAFHVIPAWPNADQVDFRDEVAECLAAATREGSEWNGVDLPIELAGVPGGVIDTVVRWAQARAQFTRIDTSESRAVSTWPPLQNVDWLDAQFRRHARKVRDRWVHKDWWPEAQPLLENMAEEGQAFVLSNHQQQRELQGVVGAEIREETKARIDAALQSLGDEYPDFVREVVGQLSKTTVDGPLTDDHLQSAAAATMAHLLADVPMDGPVMAFGMTGQPFANDILSMEKTAIQSLRSFSGDIAERNAGLDSVA
jgi:hypothetical protein